MKKTAVFLMALLMLVSFVVPDANAGYNILTIRRISLAQQGYKGFDIQEDWAPALQAAEDVYPAILWALDYLDAFLADPTWDNLAMAKGACIILCQYLEDYSFPELGLSAERLAELEEDGYDTQALSDFDTPALQAQDVQFLLRSYVIPTLEFCYFTETNTKALERIASMLRERTGYLCRFTCMTINYYAIPGIPYGFGNTFWTEMSTAFPFVFANAETWYAKADQAEARLFSLYDGVGSDQAWYELCTAITSALENESFDLEQGADLHVLPLPGAPTLLSVPVWYIPSMAVLRCHGWREDGTVFTPQVGDELTPETCAMTIQMPNVSLEDVETYVDTHVVPHAKFVTRKENAWTVSMPDYAFGVSWKDGNASFIFIDRSSTFAAPFSLLQNP